MSFSDAESALNEGSVLIRGGVSLLRDPYSCSISTAPGLEEPTKIAISDCLRTQCKCENVFDFSNQPSTIYPLYKKTSAVERCEKRGREGGGGFIVERCEKRGPEGGGGREGVFKKPINMLRLYSFFLYSFVAKMRVIAFSFPDYYTYVHCIITGNSCSKMWQGLWSQAISLTESCMI